MKLSINKKGLNQMQTIEYQCFPIICTFQSMIIMSMINLAPAYTFSHVTP